MSTLLRCLILYLMKLRIRSILLLVLFILITNWLSSLLGAQSIIFNCRSLTILRWFLSRMESLRSVISSFNIPVTLFALIPLYDLLSLLLWILALFVPILESKSFSWKYLMNSLLFLLPLPWRVAVQFKQIPYSNLIPPRLYIKQKRLAEILRGITTYVMACFCSFES